MADKSVDSSSDTGLRLSSLNVSNWLIPFCLSEKFKFATRVAISLTLAFLIPMALGWPQASTAATTVMLIASTGSRRESIAKGTLRVLGTIIGAVIGLLLVGLFAQDRLLYMLSVSVVVAGIFYIRNAYLSDPTLFMLTGVMVLMMFNGGDPEGAFLYGLDRTFMTIFGVVVYTLVGVFIFPPKVEQNLRQLADDLTKQQYRLFELISLPPNPPEMAAPDEDKAGGEEHVNQDADAAPEPEAGIAEVITALYAAQDALESRYNTISGECSEISAYKKEWDYALYYYRQITELLLFAAKSRDQLSEQAYRFIPNYPQLIEEIEQRFRQIPSAWEQAQDELQTESAKVIYDTDLMQESSHLQRGTAITVGYIFRQLTERLDGLAGSIRCIDSVTERYVTKDELPDKPSVFNWWDAENAKSAIKVFVAYWICGLIWILFNPPGGYNFVVFTTLFVSILSFLPVHPVLLFILFTLGFIFSVPSYVFILPQLSLGSELAIFIFIYTFVGFYLFKGPVTIFFLIGMFTLGLDNNMVYHFGINLTIITLFYMVVFMVVLFYYLPFSSRPEHLFLVMRERFFRHVCGVIACMQNLSPTLWDKWRLRWHLATMKMTATKLKVWGGKLDTGYYEQLTSDQVDSFSKSCDLLCHHLQTLSLAEAKMRGNKLVSKARKAHRDHVIPLLARQLARLNTKCAQEKDVSHDVLNTRQDYSELEKQLDTFFQHITWSKYSKSDIAGFYIFLNLKKNVFESLMQSKASSDAINWVELNQRRF